jgi:hypothetical protein
MLIEPVTTVEAFAEAAEPPALQVTAEPRFDFLGAEYGRLFESSDATAFQHPLWLDGLYRNLAPPLGAEPLVITLRDGATGRLAAVKFADFGFTDPTVLASGLGEARKAIVGEPGARAPLC